MKNYCSNEARFVIQTQHSINKQYTELNNKISRSCVESSISNNYGDAQLYHDKEKKELQLNINTTGGAGVSVYLENIDVGYLHFVI